MASLPILPFTFLSLPPLPSSLPSFSFLSPARGSGKRWKAPSEGCGVESRPPTHFDYFGFR